MKHVATCLLLDRENRLLAYLRDDKDSIPFPNHWDLFGGFVEEGESPEQALVREIEEELELRIESHTHLRDYQCLSGDAMPNVKHVYWAKADCMPDDLTLRVGQKHLSIGIDEIDDFLWANVLGDIVRDFAANEWKEIIAHT